MTWKGLYPILSLSKTVYQKGISLTKKGMKQVESRLQRNPLLPKWDILIQPLLLVIYFSKITLINWHIVKFLADDKDYEVKTEYTKDI